MPKLLIFYLCVVSFFCFFLFIYLSLSTKLPQYEARFIEVYRHNFLRIDKGSCGMICTLSLMSWINVSFYIQYIHSNDN